jgi:hypothetical protein
MTNSINQPEDFEARLADALQMPEPSASYVDRLLLQVYKSPAAPHAKREAWLRPSIIYPAFAVMIITLAFLLIGPQKVIAAARDWLVKYVPGFGYVEEDTQVRAIPSPVHQERDGATLTIETAVTDATRTIVVISENQYSQPCSSPLDESSAGGFQLSEPYLMAGETRLDLQNWQASYMYFPPIPAKVEEVILYMPFQLFCDSGLSDWVVPLVFEPVSAGTALPVLEVGPSTIDSNPAAVLPSVQTTDPVNSDQFTLDLKNVVEMDNSLLFSGLLTWSGENVRYNLPLSEVTFQDANGQVFSAEPLPGDEVWALYPTSISENTIPWGYRLPDVLPQGPVSLQFPYLLRGSDFQPGQAVIELDLGPDSQPDQVWNPGLTIRVADQTLYLKEVHALPGADYALSFTFETSETVTMVGIAECTELEVGTVCSGGGTNEIPAPGEVVTSLFFDQALPTGVHFFNITYLEKQIAGPWVVTWPGNAEP